MKSKCCESYPLDSNIYDTEINGIPVYAGVCGNCREKAEFEPEKDFNDDYIELKNFGFYPCVYFLYQDEEIVYVGKAEHGCCDRVSKHAKTEVVNYEWDLQKLDTKNALKEVEHKKFNRVKYKEYKHSLTNLKDKEDKYIKKYIPRYNLCSVALKERKRRMYEKSLIEKFLSYNKFNFELEYIYKCNQWKIKNNN